MVEIYVLSSPIRSGKTTSLMQWAAALPRGNVAGVLAPDRTDGRYVYDLLSGEEQKLAADENTVPGAVLHIGRYAFRRDAFQWARQILQTGFDRRPEWLIFDEIGYLELRGQGLEPTVRHLLDLNRAEPATKLLWVVRDSLLGEVLDHYGIRHWQPFEVGLRR